MKIADKAAAMNIRFEGTSSEIWLIHRPDPMARGVFIARCKYAKPKTRANEIVDAIWNIYGGNVEAFIAEASRTSPAHAARLIPA